MFNFDEVIDRRGSWSTQWDFVADRFGVPDLLPFTISDMDFKTAPVVLERCVSASITAYSATAAGSMMRFCRPAATG